MGKEYKELINNDNLSIVIGNLPELYDNYDNDLHEKLKDIHKNQSKLGYNPVKYKCAARKTTGRQYPIKSYTGCQPLPRLIRNTIMDDYMELDISSAQPTFLRNLMKQHNTPTPQLDAFLKNKEKLTKGHPEYKQCINSACNADFDTKAYKELKNKPSWIIELKDEISNVIQPKFKELYKEQYSKIHKTNALGTLISNLYVDKEQQYRNDILWFLESKKPKTNLQNIMLNHDGIYIPKKDIIDDAINNLNTFLKDKHNIQIKLKELEQLDISSYEPCEVEYDEDDTACNDYDCAVAFYEYMIECGHYFTKDYNHDDYELWWYNADLCFWTNLSQSGNKGELYGYINKCPTIDKKYRTMTSAQNGMITQFFTLPKRHEDFEDFKNKSSKYRLPFRNGIWDFAEKRLLDFSKDIFYTQKIPYDIDPSFTVLDDTELYDRVYDKIIHGFFEPTQADFWLKVIGRAMAGAIDDKVIYVSISGGNSGKSIWMSILNGLLGQYYSTFNGGSIGTKTYNDDAEKSLAWLVSNRNSRIQVASEFEDGMTLSTETLKKLVSGGDKISGRKLMKNKVEFVPQSTFFLFMNDWFKNVSKMEPELKRRLVFLKPSYNYFTEDEYEKTKHLPHIRKADPTIKDDFANDPKVRNMLLHIILSKYEHKNPLNNEPQSCKDLKDEYLNDQDIGLNILEYLTITSEDKDLVPVKRMKSYLEKFIPQTKSLTGKWVKDQLLNLGLKYGTKYCDSKSQACFIGVKLNPPQSEDDYDNFDNDRDL